MSLFQVVWGINCLLQMMAVATAVRVLWWPYRYTRWLWAWGFLTAAMIVVLARRIYFLAWEYVEPWLFGMELAQLELWMPLVNTLLLTAAIWQFRQICRLQPEILIHRPAVIVIDAHLTILVWDQAAEALLGWPPAAVLGRSLTRVLPTSREQAYLGEEIRAWLALPVVERPTTTSLVVMAQHHSGATMPVLAEVSCLTLATGEVRFEGAVCKLVPA